MTRKTVYIDPKELHAEVVKYQDQLRRSPSTARLSERWGVLAITLCDNMLLGRSFHFYPEQQKNDMRSKALEKLIRAAVTVKPELGPKSVFSYFCRTVHTSFVDVIMREYREVEKKNAYLRDELTRRGVSSSKIDELLGRKEGESYTENRHRDAWYSSGYRSMEKRKKTSESREKHEVS